MRQLYTQKTEHQGRERLKVTVTTFAKHLSCSDLGRAQNAGPTSLRLWGLPECLSLSGLDLGGACSPGPASHSSQQSNLEPELYAL